MNKEHISKIMFYFGFVVVMLLISAGVYIILSPSLNYIPKNFRLITGTFIIVYSAFRLIMIFQKLKMKNEE